MNYLSRDVLPARDTSLRSVASIHVEEEARDSFFKEKGVRLFLGDAVETLEQLPAESVDLVFADPPYGLSNGGFTCQAGRRVSVNKGEWDKSRGVENNFKFHSAWLEACRRILKPDGGLWVSGTHHSIYACGYALQTGNWHILNEICWYKPNAAPHLACRMFAHSHETLIWARKTKSARHYFDYESMRDGGFPKDFIKQKNKQMRSVWSISTPSPWEKKYGKHPTQKPFALLERIILATSKKGDLVLDPFCGSATTGVAALRHGRKFVGIDNEREYLTKFAIPRLKDEMKGDVGGESA
ncbi:MAG: site-specific DNA-methyltransferase [Proteobacteria bacterium]|nr:site-specific DNA-methyltransferase [Pseudomonadota bacterium]